MDIAAWLHEVGFDRYAKAFEDNDIDADVLETLTEADLKELGIWSLGHRRKLIAAIAEWRAGRTLPTDQIQPTDEIQRAVARPPIRRQFGVLAVSPPAGGTSDPGAADMLESILVDHGGAVERTSGGGFLAVFGSGDDTDGQIDCAVQAALAIREAAIGAVAGIDGATVAEPQAAPVEEMKALAKALAAGGAPGDILASRSVVDATTAGLDWHGLGDIASEPGAVVRAWRLGARQDPRVVATERPVVGRKPVLAQFARTIDSCLASGRGQGVMLLGPTGSGKSRLIEELAAMAATKGFRRIGLRNCGFGEAEAAGDAVAVLAATLMQIAPDASTDERKAAIDRFIDARTVERKWRAAFYDLFYVPHDSESRPFWQLLDAKGRENGLQSVLRALMRQGHGGGPLLLTIEDIHNASPRTVAQLAGVVSDLDDQPVVFAATGCTDKAPLRPEWVAALQHNNARTIQLEPLTLDEATALAAGYGDPSEARVRECIDRARGNPWFLEQLLMALDSGRRPDGATTVQAVVQARCAELDPIDRGALCAASVLGSSGSMPVLRQMIDDRRYDGARLAAERLLSVDDECYQFTVAGLRDAVYASLDRTERQDLHAAAARCFAGKDNMLNARHLERAGESLAPRAYAQAAETCIAELRHGRALALVRQGLQIVSLEEDRCHLKCLEADCLLAAGSVSPAVASWRQALEHAQNDAQKCRALIGIARGLGLHGRFGEALEQLDAAHALAGTPSMGRELARIQGLKGRCLARLGRIAMADKHFRLALDLARREALPEEIAAACRGLGRVAEAGGRMSGAGKHFTDAVATARTHGLGVEAIEDDLALARTRYYREPMADVLDHARAIVDTAARMGHHAVEMEALLLSCTTLYDLARIEAVLEHAERASDLATRLGTSRAEGAIASFAARALAALDRRDEARVRLGEAVKAARETERGTQGGIVLGAVVLLARGHTTREAAMAEAADLFGKGATSHSQWRFCRDAIDAALGAGEPKLAMRYVALLDESTRNEGQPWCDFVIARGRALAAVEAGRGDAAVARTLRHLMSDAKRLGYAWALPAMRTALDGIRGGGVEPPERVGRRGGIAANAVPDRPARKAPERGRW